jgi:NTP pyrophosphatase (non-canonical NTP hydrolase)
MDSTTSIDDVKASVRKFVEERDWQQYHSPRNLAGSISIEAAELLELFQWGEELDAGKRKRLEEELADVIIYCLSMANSMDLDVSEIIAEKLRLNAEKYPVAKARGNAKKYSEM